MKKDEFIKLYKKYDPIFEPIITKMINENYKYFQIYEKIKWELSYDDDIALMGTCDRNDNLIKLNLLSVIHAYDNDLLKDVEYFILHEVRHIFQHIKIQEMENGIDNGIDLELVKQWKYEEEHYIKVYDQYGNINNDYFKQDIEMDAYAFSYAVMKYKYGDIDLYVPEIYSEDFYEIVNWWINHFKEE